MILSTQENRHNFSEIWTCCFCESDHFTSFFDWSEHLRLTHILNNNSFYCEQHNRSFNFLYSFVHHFWKEHLHIFFVCENCQSIYYSMNDILCHLQHCRIYLPKCINCELMPCVCAFNE